MSIYKSTDIIMDSDVLCSKLNNEQLMAHVPVSNVITY